MEKVDQRLGILGASIRVRREHEQAIFENLSAKCEHRFHVDSCDKMDSIKDPVKDSCNMKGCPFIRGA